MRARYSVSFRIATSATSYLEPRRALGSRSPRPRLPLPPTFPVRPSARRRNDHLHRDLDNRHDPQSHRRLRQRHPSAPQLIGPATTSSTRAPAGCRGPLPVSTGQSLPRRHARDGRAEVKTSLGPRGVAHLPFASSEAAGHAGRPSRATKTCSARMGGKATRPAGSRSRRPVVFRRTRRLRRPRRGDRGRAALRGGVRRGAPRPGVPGLRLRAHGCGARDRPSPNWRGAARGEATVMSSV